MAEKPYRFVERRRIFGGVQSYGFTTAAVPSEARKQQPPFDKDAPALLTSLDRTRVLTIGRWLFQNCSPVRGALNEIASLATSTVIPQFDGSDKAWGEAAESYLYESGRFLDVRGWPFDTDTFNRLLVLAVRRDGDQYVLLTEDESGEPKVQVIPAHRIGSRGLQEVASGPFKGRAIRDGVILDDYGRAIGYRVLGETAEDDRDFSSNDLFPAFDPDFADQVRGFSALGASVIDWQDLSDTRRFELWAQKKFASTAILETNEAGAPDMGEATIITEGTEAADTTDGISVKPVYGEEMRGGETRYFRSGTGSKWDIPVADRPSANQQAFAADTVRQALHGIGWSYDFSLDPTKAGGAQMRIVIDKANRQLAYIRERILAPVRRRIDGWRIAKAIKNGRLAPNAEWWKWEYQFAAELTADAKYASDVDLQEMRAGITTQAAIAAKRGRWWQDDNDQKEREADDRLARAGRLAAKHNIPFAMALDQLAILTPNGNPAQAAAAQPEPAAP